MQFVRLCRLELADDSQVECGGRLLVILALLFGARRHVPADLARGSSTLPAGDSARYRIAVVLRVVGLAPDVGAKDEVVELVERAAVGLVAVPAALRKGWRRIHDGGRRELGEQLFYRTRHARARCLELPHLRAGARGGCNRSSALGGGDGLGALVGGDGRVDAGGSQDGCGGGVGLAAVKAEFSCLGNACGRVEQIATLLGVLCAELLEARIFAHDESFRWQVVFAVSVGAHRAPEQQATDRSRLASAGAALVVRASPHTPRASILLRHADAAQVICSRAEVTPTQPTAQARHHCLGRGARCELLLAILGPSRVGAIPAAQAQLLVHKIASGHLPSRPPSDFLASCGVRHLLAHCILFLTQHLHLSHTLNILGRCTRLRRALACRHLLPLVLDVGKSAATKGTRYRRKVYGHLPRG